MSRISKQQSSSDEPKKTRRQRRSEMSPEKREFLRNFVGMYDIKTAADLQDAVKDLLGDTIKDMLEEEMNEHLGYEKYKHSDNPDSRNGYKSKEIMSSAGSITIDVPQDRDSAFEPKVVKKGQKDINAIEQKIIAMYARGMTTRNISDTIMDIYGFEVSEGFISDVTDKLLPKIQEWQSRPLEDVYPVVFIDAIHYAVRDEVGVRRKAAYIVLGISASGHKDVLGIYIGENESAKYWLSILNELKNRGVKDILIVCADGLTGIKDAIEAAFPQTEYQRCIVHQVRNTLKYVSDKDRKAFANDLRRIYGAPSEELALGELDRAAEKWQQKYPNSMKSCVVQELGRHISNLQIFVRDKTRHIYDERHREPEFHIPASEQPAQFISRRPVFTQGAVPRHNGSHEEMEASNTRLGENIRRTVDNVRGEAA